MGRLFNPESNLMQALTKYAMVLLCGVLWLLCCLPVVTAGASTTTMHRMMFNLREDKVAGLGKFFETFGKEFKKSTILWLIDIACMIVLLFFFNLIGLSGEGGKVSLFLLVIFFLPFFTWLLSFTYVFPLTAYFENSIGATLRNGFLIATRYIRYTIPILAMSFLPMIGFLISEYYFLVLLPIWIMVILPLIFYFQSYFFLKIFSDLIPGKPDSSLSEGSGSVDEVTG